MKRCAVNYVTGGAWYPYGQDRLGLSLRRFPFQGEWIPFRTQNLPCPPHNDVPYAFKLYAMKKAQSMGYDQILWVDASFWAFRDINPIFEKMASTPVLVQNCGLPFGQWSSDASLDYFGLDRNEVWEWPMFSGGLIGVNLQLPLGREFLDYMYEEAQRGTAYRGSWKNKNHCVSVEDRVLGHRHDMVVGSVWMKRKGLVPVPNNTLFAYYGWYQENKHNLPLDPHPCFLCEGGTRKI